MSKNLMYNLDKYSDCKSKEKFKSKPNKTGKKKHIKTESKHKTAID